MKKVLSIAIVLVLVLAVFAGCTPSPAPGTPATPGTPAPAPGTPAADPQDGDDGPSIALILSTGGLGDRSLNDSAFEGVKRAQEMFGGNVSFVEPREIAEFEGHQREFARSGQYDLIVTVGFWQADPLLRIAPEFPDQKFIALDAVVDGLDNVLSMTYLDHERMFLQGIFAARRTQTGRVGVIGGVDSPVINGFISGFMAGVAYIDPTIEVAFAYVGAFNDPTTAAEIARSMYADGFDILLAAAGGSGLGVFAAAAEVGGYAIGVDTNRILEDPRHIISSGYRDVGQAALVTIGSYMDGSFRGGWVEYGLREGVVGFTFEGADPPPPPEIVAEMEAAKAMIIAGTLQVPRTIEDANAFREARM